MKQCPLLILRPTIYLISTFIGTSSLCKTTDRLVGRPYVILSPRILAASSLQPTLIFTLSLLFKLVDECTNFIVADSSSRQNVEIDPEKEQAIGTETYGIFLSTCFSIFHVLPISFLDLGLDVIFNCVFRIPFDIFEIV